MCFAQRVTTDRSRWFQRGSTRRSSGGLKACGIKTGDAVPIKPVKPEEADLKAKPDKKPDPPKPKPEDKKPDNGQAKTSLSLLASEAKNKKLSDVETVETASEGIDIDDLLDLNG